MAFGKQVAEFKNKTTSRTVRESGASQVVMEFNNEGTVTGKLAGMLMSTVTVTQYPDGTGFGSVKVALMGPEGEMASGHCSASGYATPDGKFNIRGIVAMRSEHPKWNWLNRMPLALESVANMQTGEEVGSLYEWL